MKAEVFYAILALVVLDLCLWIFIFIQGKPVSDSLLIAAIVILLMYIATALWGIANALRKRNRKETK